MIPNPLLATGQLVTMAAQAPGAVAIAGAAMGLKPGAAALGQAVGVVIVAFQAPRPKDAHAAIATMHTAQTLLRQQFAVHARGQRTGIHIMASVAAKPIITAVTIVTLWAMRLVMAHFLIVFAGLLDDDAQNSETRQRGKGLAQIILTRTGRGGTEPRDGNGSSSNGRYELARSKVGHGGSPFGSVQMAGQSAWPVSSNWADTPQTGNNRDLLSNNTPLRPLMLLNIPPFRPSLVS